MCACQRVCLRDEKGGQRETDAQTDEKNDRLEGLEDAQVAHLHDGQKASSPGNNSRLHDSQFGHGWAGCRPIPDLSFCPSIQSFLCVI